MQMPKRKKEENRKYGGLGDGLMTREAIRAMEEDVARMERAVPRAAEELARAREMGDLSENAAYSEAKGRLNGLHTRILILKTKLKNAVVIEKGAGADGKIRIGATVRLLVDGKERVYEIVGSEETSPASGRISHLSPIGKALIGHKVGDTVLFKGPTREIAYQIVGVE